MKLAVSSRTILCCTVFGLAAACDFRPEEVPKEAGTVMNEEEARRILFPANPTNQFTFWFFWDTLIGQHRDDCPEIVEVDFEVTEWLANGCTDDDGVVWYGEATMTEQPSEASSIRWDLRDFGFDWTAILDEGESEKWLLNGYVIVERGNYDVMNLDLDFERTRNGDVFTTWWNTQARFDTPIGYFYLDNLDGNIGTEGWGTATVQNGRQNVEPAECADNEPIVIKGTNELSLVYDNCDCPSWFLDGVRQGELCGLESLIFPINVEEES